MKCKKMVLAALCFLPLSALAKSQSGEYVYQGGAALPERRLANAAYGIKLGFDQLVSAAQSAVPCPVAELALDGKKSLTGVTPRGNRNYQTPTDRAAGTSGTIN